MDEPTVETPQPKKKGWPLGKKRGPRKHPLPPQPMGEPPSPQPPQPQQVSPRAFTEPVEVTVVYKTGQIATFEASEFDIRGSEYRFTSFPEKRGHKILQIIQKSEVAAISIMAPLGFFDHIPAPVTEHDAPTPAVAYPNGDPRVSIAPRSLPARNVASNISSQGVPRSVANVFDKGEMKEQVIGAAMI